MDWLFPPSPSLDLLLLHLVLMVLGVAFGVSGTLAWRHVRAWRESESAEWDPY